MLPIRRWGIRNKDLMVGKEGMDRRADIIMEGMRRDMGPRDSIWMIGGVALVGLWKRC